MLNRNLLWSSLLVAGLGLADDPTVVSDAEKATAQKKNIEGPTQTVGVERVENLGAIDLGEDFEALKGRSLRARRITVAPGAIIAVHAHDARPGVAYILEGELTETRAGGGGERLYRAGDTALEESDVVHWWRNDSGKQAVVLVVDVAQDEQE